MAATIFDHMSDRRYNSEEVTAIFRAASEGMQLPQHQTSPDQGLTLADLQAIGSEVGIPAEAVGHAAIAMDVRKGSSQQMLLGLPIGVSRIVELNRRVTDPEWERFVTRLRDVFKANGVTRSDGSSREWANGNLRVFLEQMESGDRLRFGTVNGGARSAIGAGLAALGVTVAVVIATAFSGSLGQAAPGIAFLGLTGVGMVGFGALRLPRWARVRGSQMEALAAQLALPPDSSSVPVARLPD